MILVALGANLAGPAGDPQAQVLAALAALAGEGIRVRQRSRLWRSPSWPDPRAPAFVNAVARVETALDPAGLLAALHRIEGRLGRVRGPANAPRAIDLDLLDHDAIVRAAPPPVLPHPRLASRAFVLRPLAEVAPAWRHPVDGRSVGQLIAALPPGAVAEAIESEA